MDNSDLWAVPQALHDHIFAALEIGSSILELGSGAGSQALVEHGYDVRSVEHDMSFVGKYPDPQYIYAPIVNSWYDTTPLMALRPYDLLIVDGPPGAVGRGGMLEHLELFDVSKPIIVDDVSRRPEQELAWALAEWKRAPLAMYFLRDDHNRAFATIGLDI